MNAQILQAVDQLLREKSIDREVVIEAMKSAVVSALKKKFEDIEELTIDFDNEGGDIKAFAVKTIVEGKPANINEISLADARKIDEEAIAGNTIKCEISPGNVGRIAAQTAKQIIVQKIKEAEKDSIYNEYLSRINDMIIGKVQKTNSGETVLVELDKIEAYMLKKDQIPGERFKTGNSVKAVISDVKRGSRGPVVYLSRTSPEFLKRLFENEIPEIIDGIIEIISVAREPGSRTKIAVISKNEKVDPVGACVGVKGVRIQQIVNELRGEKIDVIRYNNDIKRFITNALAPSDVVSIKIEETRTGKNSEVVVPDHHLSLAIGKEGQNVRLAARLVGSRIDILSETQKRERLEKMLDE